MNGGGRSILLLMTCLLYRIPTRAIIARESKITGGSQYSNRFLVSFWVKMWIMSGFGEAIAVRLGTVDSSADVATRQSPGRVGGGACRVDPGASSPAVVTLLSDSFCVGRSLAVWLPVLAGMYVAVVRPGPETLSPVEVWGWSG